MYNPNLILENRRKIAENITKGFTNFNSNPVNENNQNDELQKGEILSQFGYSGYSSNTAPLTFSKTGKWIKETFPLIVAKLEILKVDIMTKMNACIELVGSYPTEDSSSYNIKTIKIKRYPYEVTYPPQQESKSCVSGIGSLVVYSELKKDTVETISPQTAARQYNDMCYAMISVMEDIACCNVIMNNIDEKKSYPLTISQLVVLGLQDSIQKGEIDDIVLDNNDSDEVLEKGGVGSGKYDHKHISKNYLPKGHKAIKTVQYMGVNKHGFHRYSVDTADNNYIFSVNDKDHALIAPNGIDKEDQVMIDRNKNKGIKKAIDDTLYKAKGSRGEKRKFESIHGGTTEYTKNKDNDYYHVENEYEK